MTIFRRAIRIFLWAFALVSAIILGVTAFIMRQLANPPRLPVWANPKDLGLDFSEVHFPARQDGVRLSGWFVKNSAQAKAPTIVLVHDWGWNRLGESAEGTVSNLLRTTTIDFMRLIHGLINSGYNVLTFDLRNHGESAPSDGVTFGYQESLDLLGAIDFLELRDDVAEIGLIGFGIGGNAILYGLNRLHENHSVNGAIVVQPIHPESFLSGVTRDVIGPLSQAVVPLVNVFSEWMGATPPSAVNPLFAAAGLAHVPLLFIQSSADAWGDLDYVQSLADSTPGAADVIITTVGDHRYDGYAYLINNPDIIGKFLSQNR